MIATTLSSLGVRGSEAGGDAGDQSPDFSRKERARNGGTSLTFCELLSQKQVPHRAFSPIRNDKRYECAYEPDGMIATTLSSLGVRGSADTNRQFFSKLLSPQAHTSFILTTKIRRVL
jgi:hypothetical protein